MFTVNPGGTAIGTAINVSPAYLSNVVPALAKITGYPLKQAEDAVLLDTSELDFEQSLAAMKQIIAQKIG